MRITQIAWLLILAVLFTLSCKSEKQAEQEPTLLDKEIRALSVPADAITTESGLKYVDTRAGEGKEPQAGQEVAVHYTGKLMDGSKFDSSLDRNQPLSFNVGVGQMIAGFDEGVASMKVGGKRTLYIPSELAYGDSGIPGVIPPKAMIVFEVELLEVK